MPRVIRVNDKPCRYGAATFWALGRQPLLSAGDSGAAGSTDAGPAGRLQIIGAEGEDRTTIEFARLLAAEIGGFVPPPDYR